MRNIEQVENYYRESLQTRFGSLKYCMIEQLEAAAREVPNRAALLEPERESMSYAMLFQLAQTTVATLNARGFSPESRIAVVLPTRVDAAGVYPCVMAGMAVAPMAADASEEEYTRYLGHVGANAMLVAEGETPAARAAAAALGIPLIEIVFTPTCPVGMFKIIGAENLPKVTPQYSRDSDMVQFIATSGTTSLPKWLWVTQKELLLITYMNLSPETRSDRACVNLTPFQHAAGITTLISAIVARQSFACVPKFEPTIVYRYLDLYRPTIIKAVPTMLQVLVTAAPNHQAVIDRLDLDLINVNSAVLAESLLHDLHHIFQAIVRNRYGLTETWLMAQITHRPDEPIARAASVGQPVSLVELKAVDEDGATLPRGERGEIFARSPWIFTSYVSNPEANALAFSGDWFRTGDAGYIDGDGYLYLTGRVKEIINRGGSKVSPLDVDTVLTQHPAVAEAASFGFPHAALGEDLAAAIVLNDPGVTERDLRLFAFERLPMHKVPSRFVFVSELPKTALGKIRRTALADQFRLMLAK